MDHILTFNSPQTLSGQGRMTLVQGHAALVFLDGLERLLGLSLQGNAVKPGAEGRGCSALGLAACSRNVHLPQPAQEACMRFLDLVRARSSQALTGESAVEACGSLICQSGHHMLIL